jgi:ribosomal protein L11 methylase PrmA
VPYRIDVGVTTDRAVARLIDLGALDVDITPAGLAAILPDTVNATTVARELGAPIRVSSARGRDDGSIWMLCPRSVRVAHFEFVPADAPPRAGALRLIDAEAFGIGRHPTTALCLELLDDEIGAARPARVLDVGTGSGILALAALHGGVRHAVGVDLEDAALRAAARNAAINGFAQRLALVRGGPEALSARWPLVLANILAAPLIGMAPALASRVARRGRLVLSGIREALAPEVERAYRHAGMRHVRTTQRDGWCAVVLQASW